jgi:hypothetical protein
LVFVVTTLDLSPTLLLPFAKLIVCLDYGSWSNAVASCEVGTIRCCGWVVKSHAALHFFYFLGINGLVLGEWFSLLCYAYSCGF